MSKEIKDYMDKNIESYELTGEDIHRMSRGLCRIMRYEDLIDIHTPEDLFQNKKYVVMLYETRKNTGHWCLLIDRRFQGEGVRFFDPYGIKIDNELSFVQPYYRQTLNEDMPHLSYILRSVKVSSNKYRYQRFEKEVNTCGRHVITRLRLDDMGFSDDHYYNLMKKDADFLVSVFTFLL